MEKKEGQKIEGRGGWKLYNEKSRGVDRREEVALGFWKRMDGQGQAGWFVGCG